MGARAVPDRRSRPRNRLRLVLVLALAAALGVLAFLVATEPGRIGLSRGSTGRTATPGEAAWTRLSPAPLALTEAAAAHEGRVWVAGGLDASGAVSARVLVYDRSTDRWSDGPRLYGSGVHHASLVSDGSALWLIGGYVGPSFDQPTDEVWRLDAGATSWVRDRPLPAPRAAGAAAWDGEVRILFGGGVAAGGGVSNDVFAPPGLGVPRHGLGAAVIDGSAYVVLGGPQPGLPASDVIEALRLP